MWFYIPLTRSCQRQLCSTQSSLQCLHLACKKNLLLPYSFLFSYMIPSYSTISTENKFKVKGMRGEGNLCPLAKFSEEASDSFMPET